MQFAIVSFARFELCRAIYVATKSVRNSGLRLHLRRVQANVRFGCFLVLGGSVAALVFSYACACVSMLARPHMGVI